MITYTSASSDAAADAIVAQVAALDNDATAAKVRADLLELDAPTTIVAATLAAFPGKGISILVNNAGMPHQVALADISAADAARVSCMVVDNVARAQTRPELRLPAAKVVRTSSLLRSPTSPSSSGYAPRTC